MRIICKCNNVACPPALTYRFCTEGPRSDKLNAGKGTTTMRVREERQISPVEDEVLALTAVVRPILRGVPYAINRDIARRAGRL